MGTAHANTNVGVEAHDQYRLKVVIPGKFYEAIVSHQKWNDTTVLMRRQMRKIVAAR